MRTIRIAAILILFLSIATATIAQKKKVTKEAEEKPAEATTEVQQPPVENKAGNMNPMLGHFYGKYTLASRWNDGAVAKDALYDMILMNPANDSLVFNLAYFYYDNQEYTSSTLVCQELLARDGKNYSYLELSALSFEGLRLFDRALQNYETLYLLSNNTMALYKIAFLQYDLKRYEEGLTNVDILLSKADANTVKIGFNDTNNKPKDFPMKLAVMNLKGMILEDKGDKPGAKKVYEDIIKIAPDFQPAVTNLAELNKG